MPNFITEFKGFMQYAAENSLTPRERLLWFALFYCANNRQWPDGFFTVPNAELTLYAGMDKRGITETREKLRSRGLIDYAKGDRKCASPGYKLLFIGGENAPNSADIGRNFENENAPNNTPNAPFFGSFIEPNNTPNNGSGCNFESRNVSNNAPSRRENVPNNALFGGNIGCENAPLIINKTYKRNLEFVSLSKEKSL